MLAESMLGSVHLMGYHSLFRTEAVWENLEISLSMSQPPLTLSVRTTQRTSIGCLTILHRVLTNYSESTKENSRLGYKKYE